MPTPEIYRYDGENPPVQVGGMSGLLPAFEPISLADFLALPVEEQESGSFLVTGMPALMNAYSVNYKDGVTTGQKLDQIDSDLTEKMGAIGNLANAVQIYQGNSTYSGFYTPASDGVICLATNNTSGNGFYVQIYDTSYSWYQSESSGFNGTGAATMLPVLKGHTYSIAISGTINSQAYFVPNK